MCSIAFFLSRATALGTSTILAHPPRKSWSPYRPTLVERSFRNSPSFFSFPSASSTSLRELFWPTVSRAGRSLLFLPRLPHFLFFFLRLVSACFPDPLMMRVSPRSFGAALSSLFFPLPLSRLTRFQIGCRLVYDVFLHLLRPFVEQLEGRNHVVAATQGSALPAFPLFRSAHRVLRPIFCDTLLLKQRCSLPQPSARPQIRMRHSIFPACLLCFPFDSVICDLV